MTREFDQIARRLWFLEPGAARFVAQLPDEDRRSVEQSLFSLYGASVHLMGGEADIVKALERVRR